MGDRRSIRLRGYDYSQPGFYFITIDAEKKGDVFGSIEKGKMRLNEIGMAVDESWRKIEDDYDNLILDEYVIMPDHIHGIIRIKYGGARRKIDQGGAATRAARTYEIGRRGQSNMMKIIETRCQSWSDVGAGLVPAQINLGIIIGEFKSKFISKYVENVELLNWSRYEKCFWQRGYFEEIIQSEVDLNNIRKYIKNNPKKFIKNDQ